PLVGAHQGAFFLMDSSGGEAKLRMLAGYACEAEDMKGREIPLGEGLVGQCAMEGKGILLEGAPHDYLRVSSGLGSAAPASIVVLPVLFEGQVKAVIELASPGGFNAMPEMFLDQLTESIGIAINTIEAHTRTGAPLKHSRALAGAPPSRQEAL